MHLRSVRPVGLLALATLLVASLCSCATMPTGPVVVLPNNYLLKPDQGTQTVLMRAGKRVLPTHVAAYAVYGNIVAGAEGNAPAWSAQFTDDRAFVGDANTRYFILDTRSERLETDLTAAAWHQRLKELGVPSDFEIYPLPPWKGPELEAGA